VVAVVLVTLSVTSAKAAAPATPPLGGGDDLAQALALEAKIDDHLLYGQVVPVTYADESRTPGTVVGAGSWGDSGLWTGVYLGSQSFRYAVARHHLGLKGRNKLTKDERAFWVAQRDEAKQRVDVMADKFTLLTRIARSWSYPVDPASVSTDPNRPSFGGGVIHGEEGMLMRACTPTDAPPGVGIRAPADINAPKNRVYGPFPWVDGKDYWCETAPSRDTYAGTTFGLLNAFDLVGADDPALRSQIAADILKLADFLLKYAWAYPRPHGKVFNPATGGHDFDNFASPLFTYVPLARLNMAQAARHVANEAGTLVERAKWNAVWAEELASQGPLLAGSMEVDAVQPNDGYYKYNLHHLTGYSTTRLADDPATRLLLKQALGVMDKTTGDDINAHFETITYALTGEPRRLSDAIQHLRDWRQYRARIDQGGATVNDCAQVRGGCVPEDQLDVMVDNPAGEPLDVTVPMSGNMRARFPLPVAVRPPTDFLWQRPPTQLNGSIGAADEEVGYDYLLPYWMLRYATEVARPALAPFPAWPGPAHQ
jgi:hypothetical protein